MTYSKKCIRRVHKCTTVHCRPYNAWTSGRSGPALQMSAFDHLGLAPCGGPAFVHRAEASKSEQLKKQRGFFVGVKCFSGIIPLNLVRLIKQVIMACACDRDQHLRRDHVAHLVATAVVVEKRCKNLLHLQQVQILRSCVLST